VWHGQSGMPTLDLARFEALVPLDHGLTVVVTRPLSVRVT